MGRIASLLYGIICYAIFFGTFLYSVGFLSNQVVPKTIDHGSFGFTTGSAVAINVALLAIFALQHSVMARLGFKGWWTRFVPKPVERSTYVLASSLAMILLFWGWQPLTAEVFTVQNETLRTVFYGIFGLGVGLVLYSTFLIDHFDLFGLRQVWLHFRGQPYRDKQFMTPALYKHIRHPLYVGWFVTFWATPDMTIGHLLMAVGTTGYILVAIVFEERDLQSVLGVPYKLYRERTPMFVPRWRKDAVAREVGKTVPTA